MEMWVLQEQPEKLDFKEKQDMTDILVRLGQREQLVQRVRLELKEL